MKFAAALLLLFQHGLYSQTEFSQENATRILQHLILDIGPRPMGSPAEHRALEYAVSRFREAGCDTAYIMPFDRTARVNTSSGVAVGIRHGTSGRIILIGGHIDSAGPEVPGADDDGSGSATVMELARVFGRKPGRSTLVFCCFGGEEQGLEGSSHFASAYADLDSVDLMLQVDMANGLGTIDLDPDTHEASAPPWLVRAAVEEFYGLGYEHLRYPTHFFSLNYAFPAGAGSDHESFLKRGIPAIDFSTDVGKPIHTPRDNWENFDPRGLKRSGDLLVKLIDRFDGGVPERTTSQYWLYLLGHTPLFLPIWSARAFAALSLAIAAAAFIALRRRRLPVDPALRVRWSGLKLFLASLIIAGCGWLSSDVIALIRGIRHPWLTAIPLYYLLAFLAAVIGAWISVHLMRRFELSQCPYVFFKGAAILLAVLMIPPLLFAVKLTIEPAAALLLVGLAALAGSAPLKLLLTALSPWWMFRVLLSEWDAFVFRSFASGVSGGALALTAFNCLVILVFGILLLPLLLALASIVRDRPQLGRLVGAAASRTTLAVAVVVSIALGGYLLAVPAFDRLWYRDVHIDERYDASEHGRSVEIRSAEYLSGVHIAHGGEDTSIDARTTRVKLIPSSGFDTTWLAVGRQEQRRQVGDTTLYDVRLRLTSKRRPLTVSVSYQSDGAALRAFDTPYQFRIDRSQTRIDWYSFPDSDLVIPVSFSTSGHRTVNERIEVTFDGLADPVRVDGESLYIIPRTICVSSLIYGK